LHDEVGGSGRGIVTKGGGSEGGRIGMEKVEKGVKIGEMSGVFGGGSGGNGYDG
jgi:hypothetical protein